LSRRYFEIVITARQLALLIGAVVVLLLVAFGLGVSVGWQEPVTVAGGAPGPTPLPTAPFFAAPEALPVPTAAPTPVASPPTPTAARPTATPAQAGRPAAAAPAGAVRWVQVAVVSQAASASDTRNRLVSLGYRRDQVVVEEIGGRFRVRLGPFPDDESARRVAGRLTASGFTGTFVVHE
jgi:cell division septation protein DedD